MGAINSDHAGSGEESAWVKLDLSSSTKNFQVGGRDSVQLQAAAGLLVEGGTGQFNSGVTVGGATSNFNATVNINNTSSFGGPASFNNHSASFNQGIAVGGAASNFNSNLNANSNVTLGAADGSTPITINASSIDISTNSSVPPTSWFDFEFGWHLFNLNWFLDVTKNSFLTFSQYFS